MKVVHKQVVPFFALRSTPMQLPQGARILDI